MRTLVLFCLLAPLMTVNAQAPASSAEEEMKTRVTQLEKDKSTLIADKDSLKQLEKQVDDLKKKIDLEEDTIKLQQKRIENLKKLGNLK